MTGGTPGKRDGWRVTPRPRGWHRMRAATRDRAGGQCEMPLADGTRCPAAGTDCDHYGHRDDHTKLRWLCEPHHREVTLQQAAEARRAQTARLRHPTERHPNSG